MNDAKSKTPIVAITTETLLNMPGPHLDLLRDAGFEVRYPRSFPLATESDVVEAVGDAMATLAGSEPYTARVFDCLPGLRVVSRCGVGYDRVDVAAASQRRIAVAITPEGNHEGVAEHAFALMLSLARSVVAADKWAKGGQWKMDRPFVPLRGKTLGIVGLGRIGRSLAKRAAAFRMKLVAFELFPDESFCRDYQISLVSFDELLTRSDFVSLHAPLTVETRGLINRQSLARMKPGALLINTGRGGLVDEEALFEALQAGRLRGAALDVLNEEPPSRPNPLFTLDNVLISPHVAAFDSQAIEDMATMAARNIVDLFRGKPPVASLVNAGALGVARLQGG